MKAPQMPKSPRARECSLEKKGRLSGPCDRSRETAGSVSPRVTLPLTENAGKRNGASTPNFAALTTHGGLISLWDMLREYAHFFRSAVEALQKFRRNLSEAKEAGNNTLGPFRLERLQDLLQFVAHVALIVPLDATRHLAAQLEENVDANTNIDEVDAKIDSIQSIARKELKDRKFFYVAPERSSYFNNALLCGALVSEKFPGAVPDIIEAGNCYALERPTACVFHLMRVIPYGMAALARLLKVKYAQPIKCLQWNQIIDPINNAVTNLQKTKRTPKKLRDQQYFSEVVQHLYFCKDAWRNHVSHAIEPYDMPQARSVMDHVSLIMELVSKRLKKPFTGLR